MIDMLFDMKQWVLFVAASGRNFYRYSGNNMHGRRVGIINLRICI